MGDEDRGNTNNNNNNNNSSTETELPEELVIKILCCLPVKSVARFASVCKSWHYLIKCDLNFAFKHYHTRLSYSNLIDYANCWLAGESSGKICMQSLTETKKTFRFLKRFEFVPPRLDMNVGGSCHGIICFYSNHHYGFPVLLCNPSIREAVLLPPASFNSVSYPGLVFDPLTNDYKVVAVASPHFFENRPFWRVSVFSLRYGVWRDLPNSNLPPLEDCDRLKGNAVSNANGRICNWMVSKKEYKWGILSFDTLQEVLKEVPVPECPDPDIYRHELLPSTRYQACLCCFNEYSKGRMYIWVLHAHGSWSRQLSVEFPELPGVLICPSNIWINDKELLVIATKRMVHEVYRYDLGTQQLKRTGRTGLLGSNPIGYMESLVSIKGLMSSISSSYLHEHGCGKFDKKDEREEDTEESFFYFHEVGRFGIHWSYCFKLI